MQASEYKKIVVKIGSNVIAGADGLPDVAVMSHLVAQMAQAKTRGLEVVLVSSGAVAAGRSLLPVSDKTDPIARRQLLASIGQVKLINTYAQLLQTHGLLCAQILVTKEDFRDRMHYLNMQRCFGTLLQHGIVPIINENDVISVTELMFTDNDELAGLVASMLGADALVILTNVDGIYDRPPQQPGAAVIPVMDAARTDFSGFISTEKSNFGRGGMATKCTIAQKLAKVGIKVHIANGSMPGVLTMILQGQPVGTVFATRPNQSKLKRWVASSEDYTKGLVCINDGARHSLTQTEKAASLLPVGVVRVEGAFQKGDVIKIVAENGEPVGLGRAEYGSETAKTYIGLKNQKPLVHYDYLFLT